MNRSLHVVRSAPLSPIPQILRPAQRTPRACILAKWLRSRGLSTPSSLHQGGEQVIPVPLRKHLKDEAKEKRAKAKSGKLKKDDARLNKWELWVGLEIHAELNTACKLFSRASATVADDDAVANSRVALFDAAMPGSQPNFQPATLLPAIRAALALGCTVQRRSRWDRKHYFHWDQPNGYQITQYYEPFAKTGSLMLSVEDGINPDDLEGADELTINIRQIQMEQDTAKTTSASSSAYNIDLNRAGHPLIEIITLPHRHSPETAAAVVRKVQAILRNVDACTTGMELGGLRADVNVSVRQKDPDGTHALGQRTEIKNLSSFKAVEDAIIAERDRQISVLEAGGVVEGETRGWTIGATETTRLRGKEGEVDYRYMPDPDLPPLIINEDLVNHLRWSLPPSLEDLVENVQNSYGLRAKDAKTLVSLDDGARLDFMEETIDILEGALVQLLDLNAAHIRKTVANWVLHEIGGLLNTSSTPWDGLIITPLELADVLQNLLQKQIDARTAKKLLAMLQELAVTESRPSVEELIDEGNLRLQQLSDEDYTALAQRIIEERPDMVDQWQQKKQSRQSVIGWFIGEMIKRGRQGTVDPSVAREVIERLLEPRVAWNS